MEGARSILLSITGGANLSLWEVNEAAKSVAEAAHPDANIIFGAMVDEKLDDQVWVTVVATGYGDEGRRKSVSRFKEPAAGEVRVQRAPQPAAARRAAAASTSSRYPSSSPTSDLTRVCRRGAASSHRSCADVRTSLTASVPAWPRPSER